MIKKSKKTPYLFVNTVVNAFVSRRRRHLVLSEIQAVRDVLLHEIPRYEEEKISDTEVRRGGVSAGYDGCFVVKNSCYMLSTSMSRLEDGD